MKYGEFLNRQPELKRLAEQLGRSSGEPDQYRVTMRGSETFRTMVRDRRRFLSRLMVCNKAMIFYVFCTEAGDTGITELEYEFYRRLVEKQLLTYRLHGESWREKVIERPVVHKDYDEQPRGPFIVCVDLRLNGRL